MERAREYLNERGEAFVCPFLSLAQASRIAGSSISTFN